MKQFQRFALVTILASVSVPAAAVTVLQCEDEHGNKSFESQCPPGTTQVGKKDYNTTAPVAGAKPLPEMILYTVPDCDSCAQVKEFLSVRNLSVTEKNVAGNAVLQEELKDKAGDLRVPVLLIGDTLLAGYNREALLTALKDAGYADNQAGSDEEPEATEEEGAAEPSAGEEEE